MKGNTVILLPTYNERENVARIIPEIFEVHSGLSVLVIDDSSPDGTGDEVLRLSRTYPNLRLLSRPQKQGLGAAYRAGMLQVLADESVDRVLTMDADGSHSAEYLEAILRASDAHGLVIGSRYVEGGGIENWEKWRFFLSKWGNFYARNVTGLPIKDLTAGYMCFHSDLLRKMDLPRMQASGYAFLMELKYAAVRLLQCRHIEIPILFRVRREGESKISNHIIREGLRTPWRLRFTKR